MKRREAQPPRVRPPRSLLVADDDSFAMAEVEATAARLAKRLAAEVHVVVVGPAAPDPHGADVEAQFSGAVADAEAAAKAIEARFRAAGVAATLRVKQGPVGQAIIDLDRALAPDVVILGASDRGTLAFPGYGGLLDQVKNTVGATVLVVRGERWDRVTVGIDGSEPSLHAAAVACAWAQAFGLPLAVLLGQGVTRPEWLPAQEQEPVVGRAADFLLQWSRRHPHDLLVLGSRGSGNPRLLHLGSVSDRTTWGAGCSVLVVRPDRA